MKAFTRDYARFVSMSMGSVAELETQLILSHALGIGDEVRHREAILIGERVGQMLRRLHQALTQKLSPEPRVPSPESRI